ncbi:RidA family protein [Brevibacillus sp. NRS-1366]|uniref:RidA family protein n=1 Tax=Brevibacillus sp. NRS-1366 TaxID=3233899 RepID=UPI003D1CCE4B
MQIIKGNIPKLGPISNAVVKNHMFYTAVVPVYENGSIEIGDFKIQAKLAFSNLKNLIEDAGGSLKDILQVIVYLTDINDSQSMNKIWSEFFSEPYPNRATIGVNELVIPGMKIEIVATAMINSLSEFEGR